MKTAKKPKLSKEARDRVLVAKDVIAQLKTGKLIATTGKLVEVATKRGVELFRESDVANGLDVRDVLEKRAKSCTVCAKGAILIATIMRFDRLPISPGMEAYGLDSMARGTSYKSVFSSGAMENIEDAFEGFAVWGWGIDGTPWPRKYPDPRDRLIAIMENVVRNKGRFVATDLGN